ncbi:MAG: hypothetical protein HXY25_11500, partial [Alphaproteobacteria bacterium]|nr:hypothetical protein [Alphaproteobacteria bacterium]
PGLHDHVAMLDSLARKHDVTGRVIFVDGGVLADMLRKTNGVITVNSTAGLTAVEFGRPTITLGRAIYDMPGLTFQGSIDRFWTRASRPDEELYAAFRREVIARTQINGSFWTPEGITLALEVAIPRLLKGAVAARPAEGTASPFPELETARAVAR